MKTTYYALTTTDPRAGWTVVADGPTRAAAELSALEWLERADYRYQQTYYRNLIIAPRAAARRYVNDRNV